MLKSLCIASPAAFLAFSSLLIGQTFSPPALYPAGIYVSGIGSSDFNHDGIQDVVVVSSETESVTIFLGNEVGSFSVAGSSSAATLTWAAPSTTAVGDFNGDSHPDVAVAHAGTRYASGRPDGWGNKVTVHLGNGLGSFIDSPRMFSTGGSNTGLASGDFNADGRADLVVGSMDSSGIYIYLSNGDGTFTQRAFYDTVAAYGGKAHGVKIGDLNSDGKLDILASNLTDASVTAFLGDGTGLFSRTGTYKTGVDNGGMVIGDFTGDGKLDVAVSSSAGPTVMRGNGAGNFTPIPPTGGIPDRGSIVAGDFDGDSILDVALVRGMLGTFGVQRGTGSGTFLPPTEYSVGEYIPYLTSNDFNNDGRPDIAVVDGSVNHAGFVVSLNATAPADTTPPIVTPTLSGTLGSNGWYLGDVLVTWSVNDPESAVSATSGCDSASLNLDTPGILLTCSATSAGGSSSQSVTVRIDKTAPAIGYTLSPLPNSSGWNQSNVTVAFACADSGSGVMSSGSAVLIQSEGAGQIVPGQCFDLAGNSTSAAAVANIDKTPPSIAALAASPNPQALGGAVSLSATLADAVSGLKSSEYRIGEDPAVSIPVTGASAPLNQSLSFNAAGVYPVCLSVTDQAGNSSPSECLYVVIYNPDGGFVTGGGWFVSPAGAYPANPTATGKANFGFVSKYHKGANVPTGETQFQFKTAGLDFKSTSYEWLVIAGARAKYKGEGAVNGVNGFMFMLSAIDGDAPGGGGQDKVRIKIWKDDVVVYDNQIGAEEGVDPTTAISGGSIVIHKP